MHSCPGRCRRLKKINSEFEKVTLTPCHYSFFVFWKRLLQCLYANIVCSKPQWNGNLKKKKSNTNPKPSYLLCHSGGLCLLWADKELIVNKRLDWDQRLPYNVYYYCRLAILPRSGTLLGSYNLAEHLP